MSRTHDKAHARECLKDRRSVSGSSSRYVLCLQDTFRAFNRCRSVAQTLEHERKGDATGAGDVGDPQERAMPKPRRRQATSATCLSILPRPPTAQIGRAWRCLSGTCLSILPRPPTAQLGRAWRCFSGRRAGVLLRRSITKGTVRSLVRRSQRAPRNVPYPHKATEMPLEGVPECCSAARARRERRRHWYGRRGGPPRACHAKAASPPSNVGTLS